MRIALPLNCLPREFAKIGESSGQAASGHGAGFPCGSDGDAVEPGADGRPWFHVRGPAGQDQECRLEGVVG